MEMLHPILHEQNIVWYRFLRRNYVGVIFRLETKISPSQLPWDGQECDAMKISVVTKGTHKYSTWAGSL